MSAVVELKERPVAVVVNNQHEDFLLKLIERNVPIDAIEKYMDLRDRNSREIARQQFNDALANFRGKRIRVTRSKMVSAGPLKGTAYAVLSDFVNATAPELAEFGLSASWRCTRDEKDWIEMACIVRHRGGHQEETRMGGPPDVGGAKNAIQARASTISYLEKYTLKMSLGLAEENDDDDGNGGPDNTGQHEHRAAERTEKTSDKPAYPPEKFAENMPAWRELIESGKKTHTALLATLESRYAFSDEQKAAINKIEVAP